MKRRYTPDTVSSTTMTVSSSLLLLSKYYRRDCCVRNGRRRLCALIFIFYSCLRVHLCTTTERQQQEHRQQQEDTVKECTTDNDCEIIKKHPGSICLPEGLCSNPFYRNGCLGIMPIVMSNDSTVTPIVAITDDMNITNYNATTKIMEYKRVCNSEDPDEAYLMGYCYNADNANEVYQNYTEIRFMANNWESVFFSTWINQIILSEILHVPTSVEMGHYPTDGGINFYNRLGTLDYGGKPYDWDAIRRAVEYNDCRILLQQQQREMNHSTDNNDVNYQSCAHVSLEIWLSQFKTLAELYDDDIIEKAQSVGVLGLSGWYLPRYTAQYDPTLLNSFGLIGEANRHKLARMFLRPTMWYDYCTIISKNNCTIPDAVAHRPPSNENEYHRMYVEGLYTGYFRNTSDNDCEKYPRTCTGHIADWPCGWSSRVEQQTFHLKIALRSSGTEPYCHGYQYSQLTEMWQAANVTNNHIIMAWWQPDAFYQSYAGTRGEFQKISLPVATESCIDHYISPADRCSPNVTIRRGDATGACDDPIQALQKALSYNLYDVCHNPVIPPALYNPAYDVIKNFQLSSLQLQVIFDHWIQKHKVNGSEEMMIVYNDPRVAVCDWVKDNFDYIRTLIPKSYPRTMVDIESLSSSKSYVSGGSNIDQGPLMMVSYSIAIIVLVFVVCIMIAVYQLRYRKILIATRIEFLALLLFGLFLIQIGCVTMVLTPSHVTCILSIWFVNMGYTLELIPLLIKITAIHHLQRAALHMKRVRLHPYLLFYAVAIASCFIIIYLLTWTIKDPNTKQPCYTLSNDIDLDGSTIVYKTYYCQSNQFFWSMGLLIYRSMLLVWATIIAFLTRSSPVYVNESRTLAIMIYAQFSFLLWNIILVTLERQNSASYETGNGNNIAYNMAYYISFIISGDVLAVISIYIVPKLFVSDAAYIANLEMNAAGANGRPALRRWLPRSMDNNSDAFTNGNANDDNDTTPGTVNSSDLLVHRSSSLRNMMRRQKSRIPLITSKTEYNKLRSRSMSGDTTTTPTPNPRKQNHEDVHEVIASSERNGNADDNNVTTNPANNIIHLVSSTEMFLVPGLVADGTNTTASHEKELFINSKTMSMTNINGKTHDNTTTAANDNNNNNSCSNNFHQSSLLDGSVTIFLEDMVPLTEDCTSSNHSCNENGSDSNCFTSDSIHKQLQTFLPKKQSFSSSSLDNEEDNIVDTLALASSSNELNRYDSYKTAENGDNNNIYDDEGKADVENRMMSTSDNVNATVSMLRRDGNILFCTVSFVTNDGTTKEVTFQREDLDFC